MKIIIVIAMIILLVLVVMVIWRSSDKKKVKSVWMALIENASVNSKSFHPIAIEGLPEPVRRFFHYTIKSGTQLRPSVELEMNGEFSLGTKEKPNYMPMKAKQIIAPPFGFVWQAIMGKGLMQFSGSDAAHPDGSWTKFWLLGVLPVARMGDNIDHKKSSFGRYMSEAVFWLPSSVLPAHNISWKEISPDKARVTITHEEMMLSVDITVNEVGQPTMVEFQRWSNANPEGIFRFQPFGGYLSDYKNFEGFMLPTKIEAGNHFGTEDYFPFFKAQITKVSFPSPQSAVDEGIANDIANGSLS